MAVVLMEGFDHIGTIAQYGGKGWNGGGPATIVGGRWGGQAARNANSTTVKQLPGSYSTIIYGHAIRVIDFGTTFVQGITMLMGAGGIVINMKYSTSGANTFWGLYTGGGTLLGSSTTPLQVNVWYYVEVKVVISATVGSVELRLNGSSTPEILATGLNTGTVNIDAIQLQGSYGSGSDHDDLYVVDTSGSAPTNTFLGDVRVETLYPSANGANTAWTGVYTDWDETGSYNSDTDFISSSTPGDKETSALTDLAITAGTVFAVQTNLTARKDDTGTRTIAPVLRVGGTDYDGATTPGLGSGYATYSQVYDRLDPSGAAWSIAAVNALEAGVKEVA